MKLLSANLMATIAMLIAGGTAFGQVQQTSHRVCHRPSGSYVGYQACNWGDCQGGMNGMNCDRCQGGQYRRCPGGMCAGDCWTRSCLGNTCLGRCCATKAFPDSGWAPPARLPVNYDGAWYGAYHPQAFYGNPGGGFVANHPVVYQPTDTTQLGYYYHKVPTWQTRDGMIPPVPQPSDYHARICPRGTGCHAGGCHAGGCHAGGCYMGGCYMGGCYMGGPGGNCPCDNSGMVPGNACSMVYQPHFRQNVSQGSSPAAPVSLTKRLFRGFDAVSFSRILD